MCVLIWPFLGRCRLEKKKEPPLGRDAREYVRVCNAQTNHADTEAIKSNAPGQS